MKKDSLLDNLFAGDSPELCLMLACAVGNTSKIQDILRQSVDWDLFLELAVQHKVYPLVYKALSQLPNLTVPEQALDSLREKYKANGIETFHMAVETARIVKCFENRGIRVVVLKGAPLAWRLYGDVTVRSSKDIDILVKPDDLRKAQEVLDNEGYCSMNPEVIMTDRQLQIFFKLNYGRHFEYLNSEKHIQVEIHWKIGYGLPMPTQSNISTIKLLDCSIPVLSDDEWLSFLIFHGAGHAWSRLRWLVDIAMFIQQGNVNWEEVRFLAKRSGKLTFLHQSLILLNRLLDVPVPPSFMPDLTRDRLASKMANMAMNISLASTDKEIGKSRDKYVNACRKRYDAKFRTGWKNKVYHYLHIFNPNVEDIKLIALPDGLFPLYYIFRPFTWLGRYFRN